MTIDATGTEQVSGRIGRWMMTFTGRRFWPLDPRAEEVCIEDIAHALAVCNRFGGHSREPYSIAQHSIHVAAIVERQRPDLALHALLHDASEAYLGDIVRPIKVDLGVREGLTWNPFFLVEQCVEVTILAAFGMPVLPPDDRDIIKRADNVALATEARDLMGDPKWPGLPDPDAERIVPVEWRVAERAFLAMFRRLQGAKA